MVMRVLGQESGDLVSSLGCHFQLHDLEQGTFAFVVSFLFL